MTYKKSLIKLVKYVASDDQLTQASGGNISCKINSDTMRIKGSGKQIKMLTDKDGYVDVKYHVISQIIENKIKIMDYSDVLTNLEKSKLDTALISPKGKMSIEVYFHAILRKYVLHTHPTYVNAILAAKNAKIITKKLYKKGIFLDYINPGILIATKLKIHLNKKNNCEDCLVIFLKNHGIIISSNNLDELIDESKKIQVIFKKFIKNQKKLDCKNLLLDTLKTDKKLFKLQSSKSKKILRSSPWVIDVVSTNPDTVIFCGPKVFTFSAYNLKGQIDNFFKMYNCLPKTFFIKGKIYFLSMSKREASMMEEVFVSHLFIVDNCPFKIESLNQKQIKLLSNREDEKYRMSLIK